jgi:ribosomal protein S8
MNTQLIKVLCALKNNANLKKKTFCIKYSKIIKNIVICLYKEGFIQSYLIRFSSITVRFRSFLEKQLFVTLKVISRPSKYCYLTFNQITKISLNNKLLVLSTPKGILTLTQCKEKKTGGIALFIC